MAAVLKHHAEPPTLAGFTEDEVRKARRYHRPLYLVMVVEGAVWFALLALLAFGPPGRAIDRAIGPWPWAAATVAWSVVVVLVPFAVTLPLSFWFGHRRERRWGFSTQGSGGWLTDRVKGLLVGVVLTSVLMVGLVGLARWLPNAWPFVAAPAAAAVVVLLSFVAPVVLEPLFNRFKPLDDAALTDQLRALSIQAGVPVSDVLVADASRRTRRENAYVSGLGSTRRVVLFDTLLGRADPRQVRLVVAHELGHRRLRHVALGTALATTAMVAGVFGLWALLELHGVRTLAGVSGAGDPGVVAFVAFAGGIAGLVAGPLQSAMSRRLERDADRFSLDLTDDLVVFEESHRDLARSNLADLDPPLAVYLMTFSHPTPPERIAAGRRWASPGPTTG
jgi:STE24 endopeptidase